MEQYNNLVKHYSWLGIAPLGNGTEKEIKEAKADLRFCIQCMEELLEALENIEQ